ncbi:T9SS type A sorting domain-containing protein [Myroides sp. WP-1]|nr:T9SS type A sorting domain-containing protein [Myroides sp. WP-1]
MNKQLLFKLLLSLMLLSVQMIRGQAYTPLSITSGFNEDVIAENSPADTFTTAAVDAVGTGANNAFMSIGYPSATVGLPANGLITSIATSTPGLTFQLAAYTANNSLKINANGGTGTFVIQNAVPVMNLFILATSGSSSSTFTGTITFTDGTTQAIASQSVPDWYQTGTPPVAIQGIGRVSRSGGNPDNNSSNPKLFQVPIAISTANMYKTIQSIAFTKTSSTSGYLNIFAVSGETTPSCFKPTAFTRGGISASTAQLSWTSTGTSFEVKYGATGFDVATAGTTVTTTTTSHTLSGLTQGQTYDAYVRNNCGEEDGFSEWTGPVTFTPENVFQIGEGTETGSDGSNIPITNYDYNYSQQIITGYEYNSGGGGAGPITKIRYYVTNVNNLDKWKAWTVYMGHTTKSSFDSLEDWIPMTQLTQVFNGEITATSNNWFEITLDTPFNYTGGNFVVAVYENSPGYSSPSFRKYRASANQGILYRVDGVANNPNPASPPTASSLQSKLPQLQFVGTPATCMPVINLAAQLNSFTSTTLSWNGPGGTVTYEYAATTSPASPTAWETTSNTSVTLTDLLPETEYYFHVRIKCSNTNVSETGMIKFYTGYCIPNTDSTSTSYKIKGVKTTGGYTNIENLNNGTTNWYTNYSDSKVTQSPGGTINYAIDIPGYTIVKVWIDLNQDFAFSDDELIANFSDYDWSDVTRTGTFTLPADMPLGDYRIRVRSSYYYGLAAIGACDDWTTGGEIEDYTLSVVAVPTCVAPNTLTSTYVNRNNYRLGWTSDGSLFDVELIKISAGERATGIPTHTGITTNSLVAPLDFSSTYGFFVRKNCGEEEGASLWQGPFIFETPLTTPSPWREEFTDIDNLPLGWKSIQGSWYQESFSPETGTSLRVNIYGSYYNVASISTIAVGPILNEDTFSFKFMNLDYYNDTPINAGIVSIKVDFSTDFGATYSTIETVTNDGSDTWQEFEYDMTPYANKYVTIKVTATLSRSSSDLNFIIDDFDISGGVPCYEITDASVDVLNSNGPTLTIESEAANFDVEYGLEGFERGEGTEGTAVTSPYLIPDLSADTTYDIYIRGQYCEEWYGPVTFTVNAAERQTITVEDTTKAYGDEPFIVGTATSELPLTYTVEDRNVAIFENGKLVIKGAGETVVTASQAGNGLYLPAEDETFTLTVTTAELTVDANENQKKFYGDSDAVLTYTATGFKYTDTVALLTGALERVEGEDVGSYAINIGTLASNNNYTITYTGADFVIEHTELTIDADAKTKVYGQADPALTFVASGFKNNDTAETLITGALARVAGENVATYAINSGSIALTNPNYTLIYNESQLVIDPALLSVYPSANMTKVYGQADPTLTFEITGFQFNDTREGVIRGSIERAGSNNVGEYRYSIGTLASTPANYIFTIANQEKFKITPAPVNVVVAANQQKVYGQVDPTFNYTAEGLQYNDHAYGVFTGSLVREPGEDLGIYRINQGTLAPRPNYYLVSFTGADFEIVSGQIDGLTLPSATYVYDGTAKSLVVQGNLAENAVVTYTNNNQTNVGTYTVTALVDYGSNFEPTTLEGVLTITKADQAIRFTTPTQVILEETPSLQLNGVASSNLVVTYTVDNSEVATVDASGVIRFLKTGFVTVTAHQEGDANYNAATPVEKKIEVISKNASILNLIVDGVPYGKIEKEVYVIIGCEHSQDIVVLDVETEEGVVVLPSNHIEVAVPNYGIYEQLITVVSPYGTEEIYKVIIEKRMPSELIVHQKYGNVLLVNNNKETNGGYVFTAYEWFKNGESVGKKQAYSAGNESSNKLEPGATYHVEVTLHNGKKIITCPIDIENEEESNLAVYPNPVKKNQVLNITADRMDQETTSYVIYNVKGQAILNGVLQSGAMHIEIPSSIASGSYFLMMKIEGKQKSVQFIVKE